MAEENNVHHKVAMAEVFGLFLVSMIAIVVGMYGLEVYDELGIIPGVIGYIGVGLVLCTLIAFWNENILVSAAFGVFATFCIGFWGMASGMALGSDVAAFGAPGGDAIEIYCVFIGVILAMIGLVSIMQPVKILPIFLFVAAIAFILLGLWFKEGEDYRTMVGVFWTLAALLALYMATAISFLVVKGKQVLPLLIKA